MKKIIALITALCILCALAGCSGQADQVPDGYIELEIESYASAVEMEDPYTFTVSHDYDTQARLDRVSVELRFHHAYADEVITGTGAYSYNRSTDTWTKISMGWSNSVLEYKAEKYIDTFRSSGKDDLGNAWDWVITVHELDLASGTITCYYNIVLDNGKLCAEGSGTFELNTGYWSGFTIQGDTGRINVTLSDENGFTVYQLYSSSSGSNDSSSGDNSGDNSGDSQSGTANYNAYDCHGLIASLPETFTYHGEYTTDELIFISIRDDRFNIVVGYTDADLWDDTQPYQPMSASEFADDLYQGLKSSGATVFRGTAKGTPYLFVDDGEFSYIEAFYTANDRGWIVQIMLTEDDSYEYLFDKDEMIDLITGWEVTASDHTSTSGSSSTLNFYGLIIRLDDSFVYSEKDYTYSYNDEELNCNIVFRSNDYTVYISFVQYYEVIFTDDDYDAHDLADDYVYASHGNLQQGIRNNTPYVATIDEDGNVSGGVKAFYLDGFDTWVDTWVVNVEPNNGNYVDLEYILSNITGWDCGS